MNASHTNAATMPADEMVTPHLDAFHASQRRVLQRYIVEDLEDGAVLTYAADTTGRAWWWWDVRPMLSQHEHADEVIDMARKALGVAVCSGILVPHGARPYWLRLAGHQHGMPGCATS